MTGLRQNIQQKLARELSERGETPIAGEPGVEPVTAVAEPESPATTTHLMEEVCERENLVHAFDSLGLPRLYVPVEAQPVEPPRHVTRMPGGVGGVAP